MQLDFALEHRTAEDYVIPPYNLDRAPPYYVVGGLIFQELSRQYLREWGANWHEGRAAALGLSKTGSNPSSIPKETGALWCSPGAAGEQHDRLRRGRLISPYKRSTARK